MAETTTHFDLLDGFGQPGCPVCQIVLTVVNHAIESINYESVNDPGFRAEVEPAWGFCNHHAHQWLSRAHPLGTAMIYIALLDRVSKEIKQAQLRSQHGLLAQIATRLGSGANSDENSTFLMPPGRCPFCRIGANHERMCIAQLVRGLEEESFRKAYLTSVGLCLPHLRQALGMCSDAEAFETLRNHALAGEEQLRRQLHEIVRKHDYRFSDEPLGEERGSVERAVRHIAAAPGIVDRPNRPG